MMGILRVKLGISDDGHKYYANVGSPVNSNFYNVTMQCETKPLYLVKFVEKLNAEETLVLLENWQRNLDFHIMDFEEKYLED